MVRVRGKRYLPNCVTYDLIYDRSTSIAMAITSARIRSGRNLVFVTDGSAVQPLRHFLQSLDIPTTTSLISDLDVLQPHTIYVFVLTTIVDATLFLKKYAATPQTPKTSRIAKMVCLPATYRT